MVRGCYGHGFDVIVEHLHPLNNTAPDDDTYRKGREGTVRNRYLFRSRMQLWATSQ
jgi:hypothetical protein